MVSLTVVQNEAEAAMLCGMLRSNGIACSYRQTNFGAGASDGFPRGGPVELFVAEEDLQEAQELLGLAEGADA